MVYRGGVEGFAAAERDERDELPGLATVVSGGERGVTFFGFDISYEFVEHRAVFLQMYEKYFRFFQKNAQRVSARNALCNRRLIRGHLLRRSFLADICYPPLLVLHRCIKCIIFAAQSQKTRTI